MRHFHCDNTIKTLQQHIRNTFVYLWYLFTSSALCERREKKCQKRQKIKTKIKEICAPSEMSFELRNIYINYINCSACQSKPRTDTYTLPCSCVCSCDNFNIIERICNFIHRYKYICIYILGCAINCTFEFIW